MSAEAMILAVAAVLEQLGVPYMVVGSFSSNVYGIPRSTHDAGFVVQFERVGVDAVMRALGAGYELDPQMSFETVTATTRYRVRHRASSRSGATPSTGTTSTAGARPTAPATCSTRSGRRCRSCSTSEGGTEQGISR